MFFSFVINPSCFGLGELGSKLHCPRARGRPGQRQHEVRGRYWGYSGLMQGRQHSIPWMTPGYCIQNEDGSPSEEQSQDSLLELVRQRRTVDWIRQADCYLQLKKILLTERFLLSCHDHGKTKTNSDFTIRCSNTELLRQDSYPFSETNFKDLSTTRINFSRTPNFALHPFITEISKSVLLAVNKYFL